MTLRQIPLANTVFEGQNNVYVLTGDGPTTLVDTGVSIPRVRASLDAGLADFGLAVADVEQILLTHWHYDHSGLAGALERESGAVVRAQEADAPLVARDPEALDALDARQRAKFDAWGMPADRRRELTAFLDSHVGIAGEGVDVTPLADGDVVRAGDYDLETVHLPGHAAGLVGFVFEREGRREAFLGDAVLPKYTPNVGGADVRVERPLTEHLDSLERVVALDLDRAWPGHRGPLIDPTNRARDIARHHRTRLERALDVVREGDRPTAWAVSDALFGSLSDIHVLHGPGEASAHLDYFVERGVLARVDGRYERADDAPERVQAALAPTALTENDPEYSSTGPNRRA